MRPGAGPPLRRRRRPLGPTPRYAFIPRWGRVDPSLTIAAQPPPARQGPSSWAVRATMISTIAVLVVAAVLHMVRYALLIVNRNTLLNPLLAWAVTWLGVLASVAAIFAVVGCALVLTNWLISRRAAAYHHFGITDPRPQWWLRVGSLVPLVNLFWAAVFVIELAIAEDRYHRLQRPILVWWVLWVASTGISVFATVTSFFSRDTQGIADNTVSFTIAYLLAALTVAATDRVVSAFERAPVHRPARRWLIVPSGPATGAESSRSRTETAESAAAVESEGQKPAA